MNQLAIDFAAAPRCIVPDADTQLGTILRALQRGERLTVAQALTEYGCYALSQRIGDLRRMGWPICSRTVYRMDSKKRFSEYWMEAH